MQRKALGKGLSALIPDKPIIISDTNGKGVREIPLEKIFPNPHQPRKSFQSEGLEELTDSVRTNGVIQPVLVRESKEGFELVAGERRWRAAKKAGIISIPAIIRTITDQESLELAIIENLQREDLNPMESAEAYERLMKEFHLTQEQVSKKIGKKRTTVSNMVRLLSLPRELKDYLREGKLTTGHAKAILSLSQNSQKLFLGREIVKKRLSVREAEERSRKVTIKKNKGIQPKIKNDPHMKFVEEELKSSLGTKVHISDKKGRGKIVIEYYSKKERERLISLLRGSELP